MKTFILALLLFAATANAHEVRNGGSAVVCYKPDGAIEKVTLFDYWEMKQYLNGPEVSLLSEAASVEDKVSTFIERLRWVDPERYSRYTLYAETIFNQLPKILRDDLGTTPIDDDAPVPEVPPPSGACRKELFAAQIPNPKVGQTRFMIRRDLYEAKETSNTDRAGIILHEIVYRDAIVQRHMSSLYARRFNYMVASNFQSATSNQASYSLLLKAVHFRNNSEEVAMIFSPTFGAVVQVLQASGCVPGRSCFGVLRSPYQVSTPNLRLEWSGEARVLLDEKGRLIWIAMDDPLESQVKVHDQWLKVGKVVLPEDAIPQYASREVLSKNHAYAQVFLDENATAFFSTLKDEVIYPDAGQVPCKLYFARKLNSAESSLGSPSLSSCLLAADIKIGDLIYKANTKIVLQSNGADVKEGTLAFPQKIPQVDGKTTFTGVVKFSNATWDRKNEFVFGNLETPFEVDFLGKKEWIQEVVRRDVGGASPFYVPIKRTILNPEMNGLRIITYIQKDHWIPESFCFQYGFSSALENPRLRVLSTVDEFVAGQARFYDSAINREWVRTDEMVTLAQKIECDGLLNVNLP